MRPWTLVRIRTLDFKGATMLEYVVHPARGSDSLCLLIIISNGISISATSKLDKLTNVSAFTRITGRLIQTRIPHDYNQFDIELLVATISKYLKC